jgi:hypothetical protein
MKRVVMFSSGIGSWATAKRVAAEHGTDGLVLLFADTLMEDEDNYRFLNEAAENVGGELVVLTEGRDPWQVFFDVRFLGNSRVDPCSRILKRDFLRKWLEANCGPDDTVVYLGIDWSEEHRFTNAARHWHPWTVEAPLCAPPLLDKPDLLAWSEREGIKPPRLYADGHAHANCGGFCIKAGQAQFELLLRTNRERYLYHEGREQELREFLGKDIAVLRDRTVRWEDGKRKAGVAPLTMREFRERLERQPDLFDADEWGGCSCFTPGIGVAA